ncbi:hypothetical protein PI124_g12972 [Phytophthora idaei]|nr:hypothetical protein PI125_g12264 [Phytophthora idaei]KAG3150728.1 hypothetical protein PI126_g11359 [Phytophthora idaei]KAG3242176.1 hypothetical protein PI124_g12972 [Phytophthora idaei]
MRDNHNTVDCYILQRPLQDDQVKAGTVLHANSELKASSNQPRQHPYKGNFSGKPRNQQRNHFKGNRNGNRKNNSEKSQGCNKFHGLRKNNDSNNEYGIIAITRLDLSQETEAINLTARDAEHDPVWTVD